LRAPGEADEIDRRLKAASAAVAEANCPAGRGHHRFHRGVGWPGRALAAAGPAWSSTAGRETVEKVAAELRASGGRSRRMRDVSTDDGAHRLIFERQRPSAV